MVIELGEPGRYDPGRPPLLTRRLRRIRDAHRAWAAVLAVLIAGVVAGAPPSAEPLPVLHQVARFAVDSETFVTSDVVLATTADDHMMIAYALDGSGEKWQMSINNAGPIRAVMSAGAVVVLAYGTPRLVSQQVTAIQASTLTIDIHTGKPVWQRDEQAVMGSPSAAVVVVRAPSGLSGLDATTGRQLWRRDVAPAAWIVPVERRDGSPGNEVIVAQPDGILFSLDIATGAAGTPWRIGNRQAAIVFAWQDLIAVQHPPQEDGTTGFAMYRRGQATPLWQRHFVAEYALRSCKDWLCLHSAVDERVDPYTGVAAPEVQPTGDAAEALGSWEPIGLYAGHTLVRLGPGRTADAATWLGVVSPRQVVRPLISLGGSYASCIVTGEWLFCEGSTLVDAVSFRLSELDDLLAEG